MAENKESFVFYKSWKEALLDVPDEIRLEVYDCIIEYAFSGKIPSLKPMAKMAFNFIKNDLDRSSEKYAKTVERNKLNGAKGGRPKVVDNQQNKENLNNPNNPVGFSITQQNPNEYDNDNEDDNVILLKKETKEDTPPTSFSFFNCLLDLGAEKNLVNDWLKVRKNKKSANTETALKAFLSEVEKSGKTLNQVLKICAEQSWSGFKASWNTTQFNAPIETITQPKRRKL